MKKDKVLMMGMAGMLIHSAVMAQKKPRVAIVSTGLANEQDEFILQKAQEVLEDTYDVFLIPGTQLAEAMNSNTFEHIIKLTQPGECDLSTALYQAAHVAEKVVEPRYLKPAFQAPLTRAERRFNQRKLP